MKMIQRLSQTNMVITYLQVAPTLRVTRYLEQDKDVNRGKYKGVIYKLMRDPVVFYKETVVYPLVNYEWKGKKIFISNNSYCDVLAYVEKFGMSSIVTFAN